MSGSKYLRRGGLRGVSSIDWSACRQDLLLLKLQLGQIGLVFDRFYKLFLDLLHLRLNEFQILQ